MADIINNPPPQQGGNGMGPGLLIGIIVVVIVIAALIIFGLPAMRDNTTSPAATPGTAPEQNQGLDIQVPEQLDVNIQQDTP